MMWMQAKAGVLLWVAGSGLIAAPVAAQPPAVTGVVVVRAAGDVGASGDPSGGPMALGFVADERHVIASVDAGVTDFVVSSTGGTWDDARLVASHEASGLGLLAVPGLTIPPYPFARDPAQAAQPVHGATRDQTSGAVAFVSGRVQDVQLGAAATDPGAIRHDAFNDWQRNFGAPLLNICGEIVGAVTDDHDPNLGSSGSGLGVPAAWLLARFSAVGLTATVVDAPCLTDAERAAAAAAVAAEAVGRAAAAEAAAAEAAERAATAEAQASEATERAAAAVAETEEAQQTAVLATEAQQQAVADRVRYGRWIAVCSFVVLAVALFLWLLSRRSVAKAKQDQVRAETLAQTVQADLADRDARDRLASEVPAVFLDGSDAEGCPIGLRIPGNIIASSGGAVVGRNPFDSTVVLDHTEVSRRHFRLFAHGASLLIEDLNSMNGTKVDDAALKPGASVSLRHGAVLRVGGLTLTVTLQA